MRLYLVAPNSKAPDYYQSTVGRPVYAMFDVSPRLLHKSRSFGFFLTQLKSSSSRATPAIAALQHRPPLFLLGRALTKAWYSCDRDSMSAQALRSPVQPRIPLGCMVNQRLHAPAKRYSGAEQIVRGTDGRCIVAQRTSVPKAGTQLLLPRSSMRAAALVCQCFIEADVFLCKQTHPGRE